MLILDRVRRCWRFLTSLFRRRQIGRSLFSDIEEPHDHEEKLRRESMALILADPELRRRLEMIQKAMALDGTSPFRETHHIDLARQALAGRGLYWVWVTPRSWKAFVWMGVGRAVMVKGIPGAIAVSTVFLVSVARSAMRVWKLWTGRPSSVRPVVCLARAAGERSALATTLARSASAACLSASS